MAEYAHFLIKYISGIKNAAGDERISPFFIKKKRLRIYPAAEKPLNSDPCPKGPSLAASTVRNFFFTHERKFVPASNSQPRGSNV